MESESSKKEQKLQSKITQVMAILTDLKSDASLSQ
jgi:hypothetical protein